jgi:LPXTG-motif cell wall-anchored protein
VPGKNNNLVTGLVVGVIGGVALTGIIALLLSRKKKNK